MKKNTKKVWIVSLLAAGLSLLAVGCETAGGASNTEPPKGPLAERLTGFEVAAQTTVEIGEFYVPVKPEAKIDGESAFVSVSAKRGTTDLFFNGDDALLIDDFADIMLTYTVVEGEQSISKSTVLKVQDTGKPFIVTNTLPDRIYRGDTFDCSRYIRFEDLSGTVASSTMTITDQDGTPLAVENGKFTLPENSPVQAVTFTMSARDGAGNAADKTVSVPVMDYPLWTNPFDFAAPDISKVTSQFSGTVIEEAEKDGQKVIKQSLTKPWKKESTWTCAHVTFPERLSAYTYFDYIKVTVRAETNCDIQVYAATFENGDSAGFKAGVAETKTMVYDMQKVKDGNGSVIRDDKLRFNIKVLAERDYSALYGETMPENIDVNFYVYDIEFGFYEREVYDGETLNLTAFGITAADVVSAKFTPTSGTEKAVNIAAFPNKEDGLLKLTVKKKGYRTTTVVIPLTVAQAPVENDNSHDNDGDWNW